ncbi:MAG: N-formylglutamate amidohydrolase [Pirellulaceae bacterium]
MTKRKRSYVMILSCEHGGNHIPDEYLPWFASRGAQRDLRSHRGYDPGSLLMAQQLAQRLQVQLYFSDVSRLLIELNRSLDSPQLFSKYCHGFTDQMRTAIIRQFYSPLRAAVQQAVRRSVTRAATAIHISIHTFTPRFCGRQRNFDVGVLFDPARQLESEISQRMIRQLNSNGMRTVANQPYLGTADGHTTRLRTLYGDTSYVGIELELNNRIARLGTKTQQRWADRLAEALTSSLSS